MKLISTLETEVFINQGGGLSISQEASYGSDDQPVALSREQAMLVAREIMRLDGDDSAWEVKEED